jgi:glycosyltransferase involved in cell wall biosynthesis
MSEGTEKLDLSLCLINRNDAENLKFILSQMSPIVKEIIVVDTGSTDDSIAVAKNFTDKVYTTGNKYLDSEGRLISFAAPREESFSYATQPWVMWLDTDDQVDDLSLFKKDFERLKISGERSCLLMEYLYTWNKDRTICYQKFFRERIVKNKFGWYWKTPIHEFLDHKDDINSFSSIIAESKIIHRSSGARNSKERNFFILKKWLESETDPELIDRCRFYIADEMMHHPEKKYRYDEYVPIFKEIALKNIYKSIAQHAALKAGIEMMRQNNYKDCVIFLEKYISLKKDDCSQYREILGYCYHFLCEYEKSLDNFEKSLFFPSHKLFPVNLFEKEYVKDHISWLKKRVERKDKQI